MFVLAFEPGPYISGSLTLPIKLILLIYFPYKREPKVSHYFRFTTQRYKMLSIGLW